MTIDPIARLLGPWSAELTAASILLRIAAAFLFAAALGCERSNKRHSAGLRTFILVSLASTGAMLTDQFLIARTGTSHSLIAAATVLAVAVISTSSVLYSSKSQIKGLTTAAALFSCCVTGLLLGAGYYTAAAVLDVYKRQASRRPTSATSTSAARICRSRSGAARRCAGRTGCCRRCRTTTPAA